MSEILKKPYEISLWDEKKIWVRQQIKPIRINKEKYEPGKFYSQNSDAYGAIPYTLDYGEFNDGQLYYYFSNEIKLEGENVSELNIEGKSEWLNQEPIKVVEKITEQNQWGTKKWYTYSNIANAFIEVPDEEKKLKPKADRIYFVEKQTGTIYIPNIILQYYKEQKKCVIGSDSMEAPIRVMNPKLVSNVNGANTLTFSMNSKYWDEDAEDFFDNPFLKMLVNERKIKLRYGAIDSDECEWYDLIIKDIQENSETKVFDYTAKDQFVNELSKSGFDLVLDAELENNMGNITTLAETILEGSDWKVGKGSSLLNQTREEPLYEIVLNKNLTVKDMKDKNYSQVISTDSIIYGFYSSIVNQESYFQLLYVDGTYEIDDDHVIVNSKNLYCEGVTYDKEGKPSFAKSMKISSTYRGDRLVRQPQTVYDPVVDRYVSVYEDEQKNKIYGYTKSDYISPKAVLNYVTSPDAYTSTSGWEAGGVKDGETTKYPKLEVQGMPDMRDVENIYEQTFISLLKFSPELTGQVLFNSGIMDHRSQINGFAEGEEYVFRIKYANAKTLNEHNRVTELFYIDKMPEIKIGFYELKDGVYSIKEDGLLFYINDSSDVIKDGDYIYKKAPCSRAVSYSDMLHDRIGLLLIFDEGQTYYLEDVQFFKYITYEKEKVDENKKGTGEFETLMAVPGGELISSVRTIYYYYLQSLEYKAPEDIKYLYEGYEPQNYTQVFNEDQYEKIRSINAKESNRFNLIQTLCETFECWPKFSIERNMETGEISLDETDGYRQKKWVTFHEYIGKDNYAGFKYGINLKSIQRNLESDGIVSKLIVKDNSNEFAKNGFCSISRATENPISENFIYDFSYYIQQGLLNFNEVNNDLYVDTNGYIGYYTTLRKLNRAREPWIEEQSGLAADIPKYESSCQTYKASVESAEEELSATEEEIYDLTGYYYNDLVKEYKVISEIPEDKRNEDQKNIMNWWERDSLTVKINKLAQLKSIITRHGKLYENAAEELEKTKTRYNELDELIKELATQKRALNLQFYKKYSRFIQEGSWINEDYTDENLYYLDAESTLRISAHPKVSYNISVLEISGLEGYENYKFNLGDKTYMEDTEFFGWTYKDNIKTPYQEEIVVTEIAIQLDSPEQNSIRVQNYKTQFEDLFQRVAATTQSVTYHTGEYTRAANIVETNGTISGETLQSSIDNNALRLENVKDQSVVWNEFGITTTSLSAPNEIVRLVSGGLFLSNDGGKTWRTGITGNGINANYITTGQLNTGKINIMNGDCPSFRWDGIGLNAYKFQLDKNTGKSFGYDESHFVRFDQYGIYGIKGQSNFNPLVETNGKIGEDKIWRDANFALTWKGFMLKNDNGSVNISSTDDIQVLEGELERIKIGRLGGNVYGIRIKNNAGDTVMETNSQGTLWLRNEMWVGMAETKDDSADMVAKIGYLSNTRKYIDENGNEVDTGKHEIIHASSEEADQAFIVYEDGRMIASAAEFTRGCKIGNLTIGEVEDGIDSTRKLDIQSKLGYNFKVEDAMPNPSQLELEAMIFGFTLAEGAKVLWYGSTDFITWTPITSNLSGTTNERFLLTYEDFKSRQKESLYYLKAIARSDKGEDYENFATIMAIAASDLRLVITSSSGNYFKNGIGATVLTAKLFKGGQEIDTVQPYEYTYTWSTPNDEAWSYNGKALFIEAKDFDFSRTYVCDISKGGK